MEFSDGVYATVISFPRSSYYVEADFQSNTLKIASSRKEINIPLDQYTDFEGNMEDFIVYKFRLKRR